MNSPLREAEITQLRGLGDQLNLTEVSEVYLPLSQLLNLHIMAAKTLHHATANFLGAAGRANEIAVTPFVIGVAGSVAVGKSTVARLLRELLARWPSTPRVELITTDGFLFPNVELERRGLMQRKGFPESYDRRALLDFVTKIKSGESEVPAPVYSHLKYDVVPGEFVTMHQPDVLIVEGLNVLQPAPAGAEQTLSDLFDFSIYLDAHLDDLSHWYQERFLQLRSGAFCDPRSYFHRYASLSDNEARLLAQTIWSTINEPNLVQNILPTRSRASVILQKSSNHSILRLLLRKL